MDILPYALMLIGCVVIFVILLRFADKVLPREKDESELSGQAGESERPCPVCGSPLKDGERVHSVVYAGKPDQLTDIYGCPYCYQNHPKKAAHQTGAIARVCPVCKGQLDLDDYLIGRLFTNTRKNHLHVLGCTKCRGPKARI